MLYEAATHKVQIQRVMNMYKFNFPLAFHALSRYVMGNRLELLDSAGFWVGSGHSSERAVEGQALDFVTKRAPRSTRDPGPGPRRDSAAAPLSLGCSLRQEAAASWQRG